MLETTLLTGPYDWDPALTPRSEFEARIARVRLVLREQGLAGLFVGGTSPEHGALGYLTGFVPKLGPAIAFVPADGELRIAFSGGGAMLDSAQRLTFVTNIRAMRDPAQESAAWLREAGGTRFGLWGNDAITSDVRRALDGVAPAPLVVLDGELDALRRRKSDCELALVRRACGVLDIALQELRTATADGAGVRSAALAAERAAYAQGAQDVRLLASLRNGGAPQPLIGTDDPRIDPLLACIAVRFAGYWAEGLATIATARTTALAAAEAALTAILHEIRPDVSPAVLMSATVRSLVGLKIHPFVASSAGNGIGLSREEAPLLAMHELSLLQEGDIGTLRAGAQAGDADSAIVSAMVRVGPRGAELLWR